MSNYVRVSTIGAKYYSVNSDISIQDAIEEMKNHLRERINQTLPDRPDLIVLPEWCDMPGNYTPEQRRLFFKHRGTQILESIASLARDNHCYIAYPSLREIKDGTWRNSIQIVDRSGEVAGDYNKNHPVKAEIEEEGVLCGRDASIIECDFGRVGCAICFDLNFDRLRHKYVQAKPDLIVFSSMYHGGLMQQYWAYSCRAHFVSAISGTTPSSIISPVGHIIRSNTNYFDFISETINLDCAVVHLDGNWGKLRAMRDKYSTKVKVFDPGYLGSVLISSETDEFTIQDMINEFEIERLDDYLARLLAFHSMPEHIEP
jgi:hypothetical protein